MKNALLLIILSLAATVSFAGCAGFPSLPRVKTDYVESLHRPIPENAPAVHTWHGSRDDLKTYWGDQAVTVTAKAYVPDDWQQAGDAFWSVTGASGEGKPLPFLGVIHRYVNEFGTKLANIVPPFDLNRISDGLYIVIDTGIELEDGRVIRIQPTAIITEIRGHRIMPFRPHVRLFPENETDLTPAPEPLRTPQGTPMAVD